MPEVEGEVIMKRARSDRTSVAVWHLRALLLLLAASAEPLAADTAADTTLTFQGQLTNDTVDSIISAVRERPSVHILRITSAGGQADAALRLGAFVAAQKLAVTVVGYCMSACAQYVFLPSPDRHLDANGLVAFHTTPSFTLRLLERTRQVRDGPTFPRQAQLEVRLYRQLGLDPSLLLFGLSGLKPVCAGINFVAPVGDPNRVITKTVYQAYVPGIDALRRAGVRGPLGAWPNSPTEISRRLATLPFSSRLHVNFITSIGVGELTGHGVQRC